MICLKSYKIERVRQKRDSKEIAVNCEIKMVAYNGSDFDDWDVVNNLPNWRRITETKKKEEGIIKWELTMER